MPRLCRRLSSCLSAALKGRSDVDSEEGFAATEYGASVAFAVASAGSEMVVWSGVEVERGFASELLSSEDRGYGIGVTASAPNCASRKRNKRERRLDGSGAL